MILCATVLTAASVSVSGMIGWVGLVIPHLSRRIVGNDCRYLLPMSMVFGAGFLLLVDDLARCLTAVEIAHWYPDGLCGRTLLCLSHGKGGGPPVKLTVKELTYTYRGGYTALRNVSFAARQGELLSVLGPNGAGKSTLFRCILGGLPDYGGAILLDGRDARTLDQRTLAAHIAYIPQIHRPTFGYSVLDTVLMGLTRQLSPFRSPSAQQEQQALRHSGAVGRSASDLP